MTLPAGTIDGNLTNASSVQVSSGSIGSLIVTGDYTQTNTGSIQFQVAGPTRGVDLDFLDVGGTATLSGKLQLALASGFVPTVGDTFSILEYTSLVGAFSTVEGTIGNGLIWDLTYDPSELLLEAATA